MISLLQKAFSSAPHLKAVEIQTKTLSRFIDGVGEIDFGGYCEMLISVAENYDAKNGLMTHMQA
jgi:hypothetical protein